MNKIFLSILLIFSILLTACQTNDSNKPESTGGDAPADGTTDSTENTTIPDEGGEEETTLIGNLEYPPPTYPCFLLGIQGALYSNEIIDDSSQSFHADFDETVKSFPIYGQEKTYRIQYNGSRRWLDHVDHTFVSSKGTITCRFLDDQQTLYQVIAENALIYPDDIEKEDEYVDWINDVLQFYGVTDLDQYQYSCVTNWVESGENYASSKTCDFFREISAENETLKSYTFSYTKYVDDHPTSDKIRFSVKANSKSINIYFNENKFSEIDHIDMLKETIDASMLSYLVVTAKECGYILASYEIHEEYLEVIDGKLYYVYWIGSDLVRMQSKDTMISTGAAIAVCLN